MSQVIKHLSNLPGFRTRHKIIIIESDDWGSIRMPSRHVFDLLQKEGLDLTSGDSYRYNLYDTLASPEDLTALFEILSRYKDKNGNKAKFTAVSVVANPDFNKVRESDFSEYFYEPFTETLKRYYGSESSFHLWKEGMKNGIFVPQFHGREHLNVPAWLQNLRDKDYETRLAFNHGSWGFKKRAGHSITPRYQAAFGITDLSELNFLASVIKDGLASFKTLHGYDAQYFVPPNGIINNTLNEVAAKNGIKFRSAAKMQREPIGNGEYKKVLHYLGQRNIHNQIYITRNAFFEPSMIGKDWVNSCLNDIKIAFRLYKPAIISSHRVNYIGSLDKKNRDKGLHQLNELLDSILKNWPDVQFMTTPEFGEIISANYKFRQNQA